jgi:hypothetical protein
MIASIRSIARKFLSVGGLLAALPVVPVLASTITVATGANTSLATAQLLSEPDLIVHQSTPNYSLQTAQLVSPQYYAADALGAVTRATPQEFFSVTASAGQNINLQVASTGGVAQPTELLVYDPHGNLVAVAAGNGSNGLSSVIQIAVPNGDGGRWVTEVTSSPNGNPATDSFNYDLRVASPISYSTDVLGNLNNPNNAGFYAISPNSNPKTDLFNYDLNIRGASGLGPINPQATAAAPEPMYFPLVALVVAGVGVVTRCRAAGKRDCPNLVAMLVSMLIDALRPCLRPRRIHQVLRPQCPEAQEDLMIRRFNDACILLDRNLDRSDAGCRGRRIASRALDANCLSRLGSRWPVCPSVLTLTFEPPQVRDGAESDTTQNPSRIFIGSRFL